MQAGPVQSEVPGTGLPHSLPSFTPLAFSLGLVVNSTENKTRQAPLHNPMSNQPMPETLRQQLARLDEKRAAFAGMGALNG